MRKYILAIAILLLAVTGVSANESFIGKAPPTLEIGRFVNIDSKMRNLVDYEGDVTLVAFFASWCGPCRLGSEVLDKMVKRFERPDFHIVAVTPERYSIVQRYLYHEETGAKVTYPIAVETGASWNVTDLPQLYLVGRDGTVVWESNSYEEPKLAEAVGKALEAIDPKLHDDSTMSKQMLKLLAAESYKALLDMAKKGVEDEKTKPQCAYFLSKLQSIFELYESSVDASLSKGDVYTAHVKLAAMKEKFAGTYYDTFIEERVAALEITQSYTEKYDLLKKYHSIANSGRTGKPADVEKALAQMKALLAANVESELAPVIERMIDVMSHPWDPQEAHNY